MKSSSREFMVYIISNNVDNKLSTTATSPIKLILQDFFEEPSTCKMVVLEDRARGLVLSLKIRQDDKLRISKIKQYSLR